MLSFFFPLFTLQFSFVDELKQIHEPIIEIPISIVFIGNHPIVSPEVINTEFVSKWFKNLDHTVQQKVKNSSTYYVSSQIVKYPPIQYKFLFSVFNITDTDNEAFEKVFSYVSRLGFQSSKINLSIIHPYSIQNLLDSFTEYYQIKGYTFFVYANNQYQYQFCEGISYNEYYTISKNNSKTNRTTKYGQKNLKFDQKITWSKNVYNFLNKKNPQEGFGNWSTAEAVYNNLNNIADLNEELYNLSTINQCYPYWVMSTYKKNGNSSRSFLIDVSLFAQTSTSGEYNNDSPTISEKLQDAIHSFESICNTKRSANMKYCNELEKYISDLNAEMKVFGPKNSYQSLERFLSNTSTILLDALKTQIVPSIPSYDCQIPETFHISLTTIGKEPKSVKNVDFYKLFNDYTIYKSNVDYHKDTSRLIEWPMIALPLYNASYIFQSYDNYFHFSNHSVYKSIYDILNVQYVSSESLRESLQFKTINPKLYRNNKNEMIRDIILIIVFPESNRIFQPILINGNTDSFAFDLVSLSVSKNIEDAINEFSDKNKTSQNEKDLLKEGNLLYDFDPLYIYNYDFRPNSIIRSALIHMYGLTPSKRWRSLSIMSPYSQHTNLNQVSRDVAYRNAAWLELSKTKTRVMKHSTRMIKLLKLAHQLTSNSTDKRRAVDFSEDALVSLVVDMEIQIDEVLKFASDFNFDEMIDAVKHLRTNRKALTNKIKSVTAELESQLCEYAPVHLIVKKQSIFDKFDKISITLFPIWITLLAASIVGAFYIFTNRMKLQ